MPKITKKRAWFNKVIAKIKGCSFWDTVYSWPNSISFNYH